MLRCMLWMAALCTLQGGLCLTTGFQLSEKDKTVIVKLHNYYRSHVMPSAANMQNMSWDQGLESIAVKYAAECIWDHNPFAEDLGENLYVTTGALNISTAMSKWYIEHEDFTFDTNSCPDDKKCGHYTQMVWAETHSIGCGAYLCDELKGFAYSKATILVCDYNPQGNYIGRQPYLKGEPCSQCPSSMPDCENNICVAKQDQSKMTTKAPQNSSSVPTMISIIPSSEIPGTVVHKIDSSDEEDQSSSVQQEFDTAASMAVSGSSTMLATAMLLVLVYLDCMAI